MRIGAAGAAIRGGLRPVARVPPQGRAAWRVATAFEVPRRGVSQPWARFMSSEPGGGKGGGKEVEGADGRPADNFGYNPENVKAVERLGLEKKDPWMKTRFHLDQAQVLSPSLAPRS